MSRRATECETSLRQQVEILQKRLAEAEKNSALGELLGTTTHEFNNILMTIVNYAKLGLRHDDKATRDKSLQAILTAGQRASKITAGILGMARNRSNTFEPTDLAAVIEEILVLLEREMRKYKVAVEKDFPAVPPVLANGNQIQQVVLNLLVNARQAMPQGGRVIIRLAHDEAAQTVDLTVRDSGAGIAPEHLPKIFDPFFSTKKGPDESGKGGAGLGLAACRDIIEAHRGRVRVESAPGKGTAFIIRLPVAKPAGVVFSNSSVAAKSMQT